MRLALLIGRMSVRSRERVRKRERSNVNEKICLFKECTVPTLAKLSAYGFGRGVAGLPF